ncbi:MAG: SGNH/GDSL hydrolase family protein [Bacilli bacterium]|nr:SGNH/GDSL hydrolase family protein [Bacilli bacterium]
MKRIKLLLLLLFFINIKNVYASEDIYLEYNDNSIKIDIEDTNIKTDKQTNNLEYTYHDNKNNTGYWYLSNKNINNNYFNIKEYSNNKITGDLVVDSNIFENISIDINNNTGNINITNNDNKYLKGSISINKSKYISIILKSNIKIYGIVGDYVNNRSLKIVDCISNDFEISKEDNRILFESVKGIEKGTIGICKFEKINDDIGYFYFNNITSSNKTKEIYYNNIQLKITEPKINDIIYNKINKYVNNSKNNSTINKIIITIVTITVVILLILLYIILTKNKKKKRHKIKKKIAALLLLLLPLNTFAITQPQFDDKDLDKIRSSILNNTKLNNDDLIKLDLDKDNKITINDLIITKIEYNMPIINIKDVNINKKDNYKYYSNVNKEIEITSISNLKELKYCFTTSDYCEPNIDYNYQDNKTLMNIKFESNKEAQKLCIKASNDYDLESTECENKTYLVDLQKPITKLKRSQVIISEDDKFDLNSNLEAQYGVSGGTHKCEGQTKLGSNNIKCTAIGNNGLITETNYELIKSTTYNKKAIFFGDSITYGYANNGYGWGNYIGDNYDLASATNAGKSGWFISNNLNRDWIVDIVKSHKNENYDYIIMHGGCNDINKDVPLGTYTNDDFSGNYDTTTFLGGLEYYLYNVTTTWENAKIGYIINYKTPNDQGRTNEKSAPYYHEMKKVLDKWNVSYLDLFEGTNNNGIEYSELLKVNTNEYLPDNLHLNKTGYDIISPYIYEWMKELNKYTQ